MFKFLRLIICLLALHPCWAMGNINKVSHDVKNKIHSAFERIVPDAQTLIIDPLIGGLSPNRQKFKCTVNGKKYVVIFLCAPLCERKNEVEAHKLAMNIGGAPFLYYCNDDCSLIIMDFVDGHTLHIENGSNLSVLYQVAHTCRHMGTISVSFPQRNIVAMINGWCHTLLEQETQLSPFLERIKKAVWQLQQKIDQECPFLSFCHSDLNPRNIFFTQQGTLLYIDWEEAAVAYKWYDLASYSVFLCLDDDADVHLLTYYLENKPTLKDLCYFKRLKLLIRAADVLMLLASLEDFNILACQPLEPVREFTYYETIFANDSAANDSMFLYQMARSQMQEFFKTIDDALADKNFLKDLI